ncbi:MAG TPA: ABC transporter permease [Micromonosporaceae bacterium]|nr:ABC transporter permease [Micromonosporaceae bacterium]
MTASIVTAHPRSHPASESGSALRRISRLGRTEMLLFWRNRMAVFTALLLPAATIGAVSQLGSVSAGSLPAGQFVLTGMVGFVLLYVVYYNLVAAYVARRDDLVLKRLRVGELTDAEILTGTATPAALIAIGQSVVAVAVGVGLLGLPAPVNALLMVFGVVAGVAVFTLLAAVSSIITRTVEMAQLSTMPMLIACMVGSGVMIPLELLPDRVAEVLRYLPLTPVIDLVRLGWFGATGEAAPTDFGGTFTAAAQPTGILLVWVVVGVVGIRRWFRWEPRR